MTPSEYQKAAARTLIDEPDFEISGKDQMLLWNALGLCGEVGELSECHASQYQKEFGDCLWYVAAICTNRDIDFAEYYNRATRDWENDKDIITARKKWETEGYISPKLSIYSGRLANYTKKGILHRHGINKNYLKVYINSILFALVYSANRVDIDLKKCMELNIKKLKTRYPNGWNAADSKKRVDES